jgi:hypothetical protein
MATTLRKRYPAVRVERPDAPPVTTAPQQNVAQPPPVAADTKPLEDIAPEKPSPVEQAAATALQQRLREMDQAEARQRDAVQQGEHRLAEPPQPPQKQPTAEEIIANANIPDRAKVWLRQHPEFIIDPARNNTLVALHDVAKRMSGEEFSDRYFQQLDHLLGFGKQEQPKPSNNGHAHRPAPPDNQANGMQAPPRHSAPPRQQMSVPVSAAPSREVPSMATGRPTGRRAPLTQAQIEIAQNCGISAEEYQEKLEKMNRLKAQGAIQG